MKVIKNYGALIYNAKGQIKYDVFCDTFSGTHIRQVYADSPSHAVMQVKKRCGHCFRCFGIAYSLE